MLVKTVRRPGQRGTRKLQQQYGDRLVCVRYRYDPAERKRYKTVELIVEERDWQPKDDWVMLHDRSWPLPEVTPKAVRVGVRIRYEEKALQQKIKAIGGNWDAQRKLWYADRNEVEAIGLGERVVEE